MKGLNRREFVKRTVTAALGASLYRRVLGANERLGVGVIGCGRMVRHNLGV